ncbi:MAG: ATP-binding protein [Chlorobi bacterium]|nr:ATP-binding protein [Chlorobiota bacterium]
MKIVSLKFKDGEQGLQSEEIFFNEDLTLLVGASGVGKTQILNALMKLRVILISDKSFNGFEWEINLSDDQNNEYIWQGKFKEAKASAVYNNNKFDDNLLPFVSGIDSEEVFYNGSCISSLFGGMIEYQGKKNSELKVTGSLLKQFNNGKQDNIVSALLTITNSVSPQMPVIFPPFSISIGRRRLEKDDNLTSVEFGTLNFLYNLFKKSKQEFEKIRNIFSEIFPTVSNIEFREFNKGENIVLFIKDSGNWVDETNISSGMLRTLTHLTEIFHAPKGSIILIDEFENGLGINCIGAITEELVDSERDLQFIITSHHPYIINNIPYENWLVVSRDGNTIKTHTAKELRFDESKHKNFTQLINSDIYNTGTAQ